MSKSWRRRSIRLGRNRRAIIPIAMGAREEAESLLRLIAEVLAHRHARPSDALAAATRTLEHALGVDEGIEDTLRAVKVEFVRQAQVLGEAPQLVTAAPVDARGRELRAHAEALIYTVEKMLDVGDLLPGRALLEALESLKIGHASAVPNPEMERRVQRLEAEVCNHLPPGPQGVAMATKRP